MSTIGKNIRKIRTVKKLSQAAFAELFHLARPSVGAYEEGRAEPKIETVIQMANHFGISIDGLLTKELTINDLYKFDLHAKELIVHNKKNEKNYDSIRSLFVPGSKQMEYIVQNSSKDFLSSLPRILIPGYENENIRAFEVSTEEMHDNFRGINNGDIIIGKKIEKAVPPKLKTGSVYVLVLKGEILIRRHESGDETLLLKADNPGFAPRKVDSGELIEIWETLGVYSTNIKPPSVLADRVMYLENALEKLESRLKKLEKGK